MAWNVDLGPHWLGKWLDVGRHQRCFTSATELISYQLVGPCVIWMRFLRCNFNLVLHYCDVTMTMMASQITSLTVVYLIVYSDADQRKHQSAALLAFVRGIHRWPVNSRHKGPVTRKNVSIWWRRHDWLVSADLIIMPYRCMPTHNEQWACTASRSSLFTWAKIHGSFSGNSPSVDLKRLQVLCEYLEHDHVCSFAFLWQNFSRFNLFYPNVIGT